MLGAWNDTGEDITMGSLKGAAGVLDSCLVDLGRALGGTAELVVHWQLVLTDSGSRTSGGQSKRGAWPFQDTHVFD
jgi:hypothetical protein